MIDLEGYSVGACLGRTAQSDVYAGQCLADGRNVTIKVYKRSCASFDVTRADREFHILRELRESAGVVRPVEVALAGGFPTIVTEYIEGTTLAEYVEDHILGLPFDASTFLQIATQLAETLAEIHACHYVHKDFRPQNVIIAPATLETTIIDFGTAGRLGSAHTFEDAPTRGQGCWAYAAPEQTGRILRGVDYRTDLYALGACLYHLLVGEPPFSERDPLELMLAHVTRLPAPPSERNPAVPAPLSALVMKLLAKQPEQRYQSSRSLVHDLRALAHAWQRERKFAPDFVPASLESAQRISFPDEIHGREVELRRLAEALDSAAEGSRQLVVISGETGSGKSSLVRTLADAASRRGGHFLHGKFDVDGPTRPYRAIAAALEMWAAQILVQDDERVAHWRARIRDGLGDIVGVLPTFVADFEALVGAVPPAAALGPKATRARLELALCRLLQAIARPDEPLVLALDDVQWADEASLALLRASGALPAQTPILIACTQRTTPAPTGFDTVARALRAHGVSYAELEIGPLSPEASADLIAAALECELEFAATVERAIRSRTHGNPFLIQRFVDALREQGLLCFKEGSGWTFGEGGISDGALAPDVAELMADRVRALPARTTAVLELASCVGDAFGAETLARLSPVPRAQIEQSLFELADAGLICACRGGFRFAHDRIREAAQALLSEAERAVLHRDIALGLLDRLGPEDIEAHAIEIADHVNRALEITPESEHDRILLLNAAAGRRALAAGAFDAAARYLSVARRLAGAARGDERTAEWLALNLECAEVERINGHADRAQEILDAVAGVEGAPTLEARKLALQMQLHVMQRTPDEVIDLALEAFARFGVRFPRRPSRLRLWIDWLRTEARLRVWRPPERCRGIADRDGWDPTVIIWGAAAGAMHRAATPLGFLSNAYVLRRAMRRGGELPRFAVYLAGYSSWQIPVMGSYRSARRALELAKRVAERGGQETPIGVLVSGWVRLRRTLIRPLRDSERARLENGDTENARALVYIRTWTSLLTGEPLSLVCELFGELSMRGRRSAEIAAIERLLRCLLEPKQRRIDGALDAVDACVAADPASAGWLRTASTMVLCFLGESERALRESDLLGSDLFQYSGASSHVVDHCFYRGLATADQATGARGMRRRVRLRELARLHRRLRRWARHGPDFVHMELVLRAERARLRGDPDEARQSYEAARARASQVGYTHHAGLAAERQARGIEAATDPERAAALLADARDAYARWGAKLEANRPPR